MFTAVRVWDSIQLLKLVYVRSARSLYCAAKEKRYVRKSFILYSYRHYFYHMQVWARYIINGESLVSMPGQMISPQHQPKNQ